MNGLDSQKAMGLIIAVIGSLLLVLLLGDLILKIIGGLLLIKLINHGLQMQGLPPLQTSIINLFKQL